MMTHLKTGTAQRKRQLQQGCLTAAWLSGRQQFFSFAEITTFTVASLGNILAFYQHSIDQSSSTTVNL